MYNPTYEDLVKQLKELTKNWNAHDDISEIQQRRCRSIGEDLHKIGGTYLMRDAYYKARGANQYALMCDCFWDGIGDWRW